MVGRSAIPEKLYFKIGEVARLTGIKPYVLRYWETEFKALAPLKSRSGQRLYRRRDVEVILQIKELLYEQRFTIEGARKKLREDGAEPVEESVASDDREALLAMRQEVVEIIELTQSTVEIPAVPLPGKALDAPSQTD